MREKVWKVIKLLFRGLRNLIILGYFIWVAASIVELKSDIVRINESNTKTYNTQAEIYTKVVAAITVVAEYTKNTSIDLNDKILTLAEFLKELRDKVQNIEAYDRTNTQENKSAAKDIDSRPAYEYIKDRIVYMVERIGDGKQGGIGTGVVIKVTEDATYILTNKHVCTWDKGNVCYVLNEGEKYPITLVKQNEVEHDIQIVKTDKPIPGKLAVKGIQDVVPQDKIYFVGNNNGNPFMYSEGTVAGFVRDTGDLLVGAPSGPGNSGSGIFNQDGYLVGILYAGQVFEITNGIDGAMDTSHGICVNSTVLRLFLSEYVQ